LGNERGRENEKRGNESAKAGRGGRKKEARVGGNPCLRK
jgi:hypothetical protein